MSSEFFTMSPFNCNTPAFGRPGKQPRWTRSAKDAVGTAYSTSSKVWFTISRGVLNEVYYPTIDKPQIRDLQFLITDGKSFAHSEKHDLDPLIMQLSDHALGFQIKNSDRHNRYHILKEIISNPHQDCVLISCQFNAAHAWKPKIKLFALLEPHLGGGGWGNNGYVTKIGNQKILVAEKSGLWVVLGCTIPFKTGSCGYVGTSSGWDDLKENYKLDWEFDSAEDGNIALTGEIDLNKGLSFILGLAFGDSFHSATTALFQSLHVPYPRLRKRFMEQWDRTERHILPMANATLDGGRLYHISHSLLSAHEDKTYEGAFIASLSIPWGDTKGDEDLGGYHLVWTRDMCQSATGLLASGNLESPFRALIYLVCSQESQGGFYQNFWINGQPYFRGIQLDEVSFPIILAWKLFRDKSASANPVHFLLARSKSVGRTRFSGRRVEALISIPRRMFSDEAHPKRACKSGGQNAK